MTRTDSADRGDVKIFGTAIISEIRKSLARSAALIETANPTLISAPHNLKLQARYTPGLIPPELKKSWRSPITEIQE